jgi:hypothetical protein
MKNKTYFVLINSNGKVIDSGKELFLLLSKFRILPGAEIRYIEEHLIEDEYIEVLNISILNNHAEIKQNDT